MKEKDLIKNLKQFKKVEPKKEWVTLNKQEILGEQENSSVFDFVLNHKPALASASLFCFVAILVTTSYNALPGDRLFSIRKTTEQVELTARFERAKEFVIAQRRLEDLRKSQERADENIEAAVSEMQVSMSKATEEALENPEPEVAKDIINIDKEVQSLGINIENDEEIKELYKREAERVIEDVKEMSLTEEQEKSLEQAIVLFENEEYGQALEIILEIGS